MLYLKQREEEKKLTAFCFSVFDKKKEWTKQRAYVCARFFFMKHCYFQSTHFRFIKQKHNIWYKIQTHIKVIGVCACAWAYVYAFFAYNIEDTKQNQNQNNNIVRISTKRIRVKRAKLKDWATHSHCNYYCYSTLHYILYTQSMRFVSLLMFILCFVLFSLPLPFYCCCFYWCCHRQHCHHIQFHFN